MSSHGKYSYALLYPWAIKALKRDKHKCVKCNSINSLLVHHIDGSRKNGWLEMNNSLSNLITLCRPCHAEEHGVGLRFKRTDNHLIKELRNYGLTYQTIGNYLGISRQRVHQLIKR